MAKKTNLKTWLVISMFLLGLVSNALADIIYVDASVLPGGDGTTWSTAYKYLQDALAGAESGDQVWVAQGIYKPDEDTANPTGTGDRIAAFALINNVEIKGGYAGYSAPDPDARDIGLYETVLSGDIGILDDNSDNCCHVFYHPETTGLDATAVLDGVTITAGNANIGIWAEHTSSGGGMYNRNSSPTVTNCTFTGNSANWDRGGGGGMENYYSSPTVTNCTFTGNSAYWGGGICNDNDCTMTVTNCTFSGNSAGPGGGGGMCNWFNCNPTVTNCTFTGNSADVGLDDNGGGGGMLNFMSSPTLTNCIFWGNKSASGSEIKNRSDSVPVISYCDIEGSGGSGPDWNTDLGSDQGGNIDDDSLFVDPNGLDGIIGTKDDNLRLSFWSPCIDVGDNSVVDANSTDLDGNERIINGIVDMGAYEALGAIVADVHIVPRVINRNNRLKRVIAIMRLPADIAKGDVVRQSFELYAPGLDSEPVGAIWERVIGGGNKTRIFVLFDKDEVMNLVEDVVGRVELTVVGKLESGQYIQGSDTVRIVKPRRPKPNWQSGKKK